MVADEPDIVLLDVIRRGDTVLDIGANVGRYTALYAEAVGPTGHVRAVEPHPTAAEALRERCAVWPWVTVEEAAVSDEPGLAVFYADGEDSQRSSLWAANRLRAGESYPVTVTTLDALVGTLPKFPRLIKIDAQGAEARIVAGGSAALDAQPIWQIEVWPWGLLKAGTDVQALCDPFMQRGYRPMTRTQVNRWAAVQDGINQCRSTHSAFDLVLYPMEFPMTQAAS